MPPIFWVQKQDIGPSPRTGHAMASDTARNRVVVFGGDPGGPPLADTWQWDGALWTQTGDIGPGARHSAALAEYESTQRLVLFGGAAGSALFGDTWSFDGAEWAQVADTGPQARTNHALAYDRNRQRLVLFGGDAGGVLGDTWEWAGSEWVQVQDVGPSARSGHAMAFDPASGHVILFGGAEADGNGLGDTWSWDGTNWTQVADSGPDPRLEAAMLASGSAAAGTLGGVPLGTAGGAGTGGSVLLFGGVSSVDPGLSAANRITYGDTWRYEATGWTKEQDIGPAPRWGHGAAWRAASGKAVVFGGATAFAAAEDAALVPGLRNDTWEVPDAAAAIDPTIPDPTIPDPTQPDPNQPVNNPLPVGVFPATVIVQPNWIDGTQPLPQIVATVSANTVAPAGLSFNYAVYSMVNNVWSPVPYFSVQGGIFDGTSKLTTVSVYPAMATAPQGSYAVGASDGTNPTVYGPFTIG